MQCSKPAAANAAIGGITRNDPVDVRARAEAHPDGHANQRIAHDTEGQRRNERERRFRIRDVQRRQSDRTATKSVLRRVEHQRRGHDRTDKIADERKDPVEQNGACRHLPARPGHDKQIVACEELRPSNDDHDETGGKHQPDKGSRTTPITAVSAAAPALTVVAKIAPKETNAPANNAKHKQSVRPIEARFTPLASARTAIAGGMIASNVTV